MVDINQKYQYDFFSGANIGIYFGETRLVEIVGVEFTLTQTKRPIYGWASQLYDGVSDGIVQCVGSMYLNFRQAHLMTSLIDNAQKPIISDDTGDPEILLGDSLSDLLGGSLEYFENLEEGIWGPEEQPYNPTPTRKLPTSAMSRRPDAHGKGLRIWITYGDYFGNNGANTIRTLHGVHITGFGQTVEINGNPVLEAYNFLARQVT